MSTLHHVHKCSPARVLLGRVHSRRECHFDYRARVPHGESDRIGHA
jgi:hypothetical protein